MTDFPALTKEKYHITGFRLIDFDSRNFITCDVVKYILMIQDMMFVKAAPVKGDACIFDAKEFTLWHFMKVASSVTAVRHFMKYVQEAAPLRIIQNHFVNCSPVLSKVIAFLRPFMKKELSDAMHFHTSGFESLHEFIPPDCLPEEYGGTVGCLDDYYKTTISNLNELRDYFLKDENFFISDD